MSTPSVTRSVVTAITPFTFLFAIETSSLDLGLLTLTHQWYRELIVGAIDITRLKGCNALGNIGSSKDPVRTYTWAFRRTQLRGGLGIPGCFWMGSNNRGSHGVGYTGLHPCSPRRLGFHRHMTPRQCPVYWRVLPAWYAPEDPPAFQTADFSYRYKTLAPIRRSERSCEYEPCKHHCVREATYTCPVWKVRCEQFLAEMD